jgi:hypothetical protein
MRRLLVYLALTVFALGFGGVLVVSLYGWSQGFRVADGLLSLLVWSDGPVSENPTISDVSWQRVSWMADIENPELNESSGLTASEQHPGVLWTINDSGSEAALFAMDLQGRHPGRWPVDVTRAVDWESLDSFQVDGVEYLIIGDTGDNFLWRPYVWFLVVAEPTSLATDGIPLRVAWQTKFTYPQGVSRDSEALAVDPSQEHVLVLSKRHYPPELFSVALRTTGEDVAQAQLVTELRHLPRPTERDLREDEGKPYRHTPTGMDLAGTRLLVTTYKHAYLYDITDLAQAPKRVRLPTLGQREAVTFARGRNDVAYVSKERRYGVGVADLFMIEMPRASAQMPAGAPASDR